MFKKWFIIGGTAVVVIAAVVSISLSYIFNENRQTNQNNPADTDTRAVSAISATPVPFARLITPVTLKGHALTPEDFLSDSPENDNVTVSFVETVSFDVPGLRYAILLLSELERSAETKAAFYILEPARIVERETGVQSADIKPEEFIANSNLLNPSTDYEMNFVTDLSLLDLHKIRRYEIELIFNGIPFKSTLNITDTQPPSAEPVDVTVNTGQAVVPEDFLQEVYDASPYTVIFEPEEGPDVFKEGTQTVTVMLEDSHGSISRVNAELTVLPNTAPPVFTGVRDMEVLLGDTVMYRRNVEAADSFGNPLSFTVESKNVDTGTPGIYPVSYTATDANGNTTTKTANITVVEISEEKLDEMIHAVLDKIITDDMTQYEKAHKIFNWVCNNVTYVSDAPKDSVYEGAYRGFQYRQGDCFTFYSVSEVLLTYVGIDNMRVIRSGGTTNHFWNLVNADGNGWYHFDATPTRVHGLDRFMFTDSMAEAYTEQIYEETQARNYYTYDKELYPEVVQ